MSLLRPLSLVVVATLALTLGATATEPAASEEPPATEAAPYRLSQREYRLLLGPPTELEVMSAGGLLANKLLTDLYVRGIGPHVPRQLEPYTQALWSIWWTFNFSLWPHEMGHWARADQIGGAFVIEGYGFPFPRARMEIPEDFEDQHGSLTSVGGFEVNHLMMRQTHVDLYDRGYAHSDELIHSFIQEVYFPMYTLLVAWARPNQPDTWTDTRGDPVEGVLSIYQAHSGKEAVRADGSVDSELSALYRETFFVNLGTLVLDPMLYQNARAFGVSMYTDYGLLEPWLLGDDRLGWMYSTRFHLGPLGYEVWLTNYLRLLGKTYVVSFKAGRPYKNLGLRLNVPALVETDRVELGIEGDLWEQDHYGTGGAAFGTAQVRVHRGLGVIVKGGYKSEGYVIGRRLEASPLILAGLTYAYEVP